MDKHTVYRSNDATITFVGECIAHTASSPNQAMGSSYSGSTGEWSELSLYRTEAGRYICARVDRTQWQGCQDVHSAGVADTHDDIIDFFGQGLLAHEVYEQANIQNAIFVD